MRPGPRRLWVKICGVTSPEAAQAAAEAGADAVGFVFASGPRRVDPDRAARIAAQLPPGVARVGVFVDPEPEAVLACAEQVGLTHVQLHGRVPEGLTRLLRARGLIPLQVVRVPPRGQRPAGVTAQELARRLAEGLDLAGGEPVLADTAWPGQAGGTGVPGDWEVAAALAFRLPLVLAGGLNPDNVAEAVRAVRPWGVDVSSGVERQPGVKDPELVHRFVAAARAALEEARPAAAGKEV